MEKDVIPLNNHTKPNRSMTCLVNHLPSTFCVINKIKKMKVVNWLRFFFAKCSNKHIFWRIKMSFYSTQKDIGWIEKKFNSLQYLLGVELCTFSWRLLPYFIMHTVGHLVASNTITTSYTSIYLVASYPYDVIAQA